MNYLFIDTSINQEIRVGVLKGDEFKFMEEIVEFEYSEKLISVIDRVLVNNEIAIGQINKIFVIEGPGRFSALRTSISTSNTLAWQLNIPLVPMSAMESDESYWEKAKTRMINYKNYNNNFKNSIVPKYEKEPNITIKKGE